MSSSRLFLLFIDNCLKCFSWRLLMQLALKSSSMTSSSTFSDDMIATRFFLRCCSILRIPSSVECENIDNELQDSKIIEQNKQSRPQKATINWWKDGYLFKQVAYLWMWVCASVGSRGCLCWGFRGFAPWSWRDFSI